VDGGGRDDLILLEHQVELINRFPDQNPNPVMRVDDGGTLLYANVASASVVDAMGATVGEALPEPWLERVRASAASPDHDPVEIECDRRTFDLLAVAVPEFGFINVYGTDVTAARVFARFPDRNPNPVFRVTPEGRLSYANAASAPILRAMGVALGEPLPPAPAAQIVAGASGTGPPSFEVQGEGRTYALFPVTIPEFELINVYGTDITARRAIDKFPDENPNPVLRVERDGRLQYANPASRPILDALGLRVGTALPAGLAAEIEARVAASSRERIEVEAGERLYALLVVSVYEFGFINLYGTDITAARAVEIANRENERLLLNILPEPIAKRLRAGEGVIADRVDDATLLFADIVNFTIMSSRMGPADVVALLNDVFSLFDGLVDRYDLEKIKTIGDAYMVVGGLPGQSADHVARVADMAIELGDAVTRVTGRDLQFRVGIHVGPLVAGVIGVKKFIYDVWGDTVNVASRMESHGIPGRIQVTSAVRERLLGRYTFEARGTVEIRGKGPMSTWFLTGRVAGPQARAAAAASLR
jgi:class 3 adenylate cyclase